MPRERIEVQIQVPSAAVPEWVVKHPKLSAQAVRTYAILALCGTGGRVKVTLAQLAAKTPRSSVSTTQRALTELVAEGAVEAIPILEDGARVGTLYSVAFVPPVTRVIPTGETPLPTGGNPARAEKSTSSNQDQELDLEPLAPPAPSPTERRLTEQQAMFGAIEAACGLDPSVRLLHESKVGKVAGVLRGVGATAADVPVFAAAYRAHWPGIDLTPTAMLSHWSAWKGGQFAPAQPKVGAMHPLDAMMIENRRLMNGTNAGVERDRDAPGGELPERADSRHDPAGVEPGVRWPDE